MYEKNLNPLFPLSFHIVYVAFFTRLFNSSSLRTWKFVVKFTIFYYHTVVVSNTWKWIERRFSLNALTPRRCWVVAIAK